jgi:hypothetical protein
MNLNKLFGPHRTVQPIKEMWSSLGELQDGGTKCLTWTIFAHTSMTVNRKQGAMAGHRATLLQAHWGWKAVGGSVLARSRLNPK